MVLNCQKFWESENPILVADELVSVVDLPFAMVAVRMNAQRVLFAP